MSSDSFVHTKSTLAIYLKYVKKTICEKFSSFFLLKDNCSLIANLKVRKCFYTNMIHCSKDTKEKRATNAFVLKKEVLAKEVVKDHVPHSLNLHIEIFSNRGSLNTGGVLTPKWKCPT